MAFLKKTYMKAKKKAFGDKGFRGRYDPTRVGVNSLTNLAKDIKHIQSVLNVEKKYTDIDVQTSVVGQVYYNLSGVNTTSVTPSIPQGISNGQRIGNSLKFTGASFPIQFCSQGNTKGSRKFRVMMFKVLNPNTTVTTAQLLNDYYDINPLTGVVDYNSPRAYRTGKQDGIKLIRSKNYYLKTPTEFGASNLVDGGETQVTTVKFNVKLKDVVRYNNNADPYPDGTQYFIAIFCDSGNSSPTLSPLDVPVPTGSSGAEVRMGARWWYVDN